MSETPSRIGFVRRRPPHLPLDRLSMSNLGGKGGGRRCLSCLVYVHSANAQQRESHLTNTKRSPLVHHWLRTTARVQALPTRRMQCPPLPPLPPSRCLVPLESLDRHRHALCVCGNRMSTITTTTTTAGLHWPPLASTSLHWRVVGPFPFP